MIYDIWYIYPADSWPFICQFYLIKLCKASSYSGYIEEKFQGCKEFAFAFQAGTAKNMSLS